MELNYKGNILTQLFKALEKRDGLSTGEKLFSILRKENLKTDLFYATDKQIYTAITTFIDFPIDEEDLAMTDEEFEAWVNTKIN